MSNRVYVKAGKRGKFILVWHDSKGVERQKTTEIPALKSKRKLAEREAASMELSLDRETTPQNWEDFRKLYAKFVESNIPKSKGNVSNALATFEEICNPSEVGSVDFQMLDKFVAGMLELGRAQATIDGYLKRIKRALNWAYERQFIPNRIRYSRKVKQRNNLIRDRQLTPDDLDRMLKATETVRPQDYDIWKFYLKGLYYSGLRRTESVNLGWGFEYDIRVSLAEGNPHYVILEQKSREEQLLTIAPEFVELLESVPKRLRRGRVFKLPKKGVDFPDPSQVGRVVLKIAKAANIVVNTDGDFATCQSFRQSFGTRWATKVRVSDLKQLMRHKDIKTTEKYYIYIESQDLWQRINEKERVEA